MSLYIYVRNFAKTVRQIRNSPEIRQKQLKYDMKWPGLYEFCSGLIINRIFIDVIMCLIKREFLVKVIVGFNG